MHAYIITAITTQCNRNKLCPWNWGGCTIEWQETYFTQQKKQNSVDVLSQTQPCHLPAVSSLFHEEAIT